MNALTPISYNLAGASAVTGLSVTKLKQRVKEGVLVARFEGKDYLFEPRELERFIGSLPQDREVA